MAVYEKLGELMENKEFQDKISTAKSADEVKTLVKEFGIEVPDMESSEYELTDDQLEGVAGGFGITGLLAALEFLGGAKWLSNVYNGEMLTAYKICKQAIKDQKSGNMYKSHSRDTVDEAMKTLKKGLDKAGFGWLVY